MSELESPPQGADVASAEPRASAQQTVAPGTAYGATPPPPPPARPRKSRAPMFFFGAISGCLLVVVAFIGLAILVAAAGGDAAALSLSPNKVAVIAIEGTIVDARDTLESLETYVDNPTVKAIVIRINSPGGAVAPSQEIYGAIRRAREESGKPIVASLDTVAASGGFYVAAACDRIVANPGSITGSIGVILQWFEMKELVEWAKMKPETITSGALKDAGSPFEELSPAERAYLQGIVMQLHQQFVRDVAQGRNMKIEDIARVADGRVFTGETALSLKLIDNLGGIDEAVRVAGELAGIQGEPTRVWPRPREPRLIELLAGSGAESALEWIANRRIPQFLYRW